MSGWTKLFAPIVTSSVWCESHATVRVWIAMLATADFHGVVEGSLPGFASLARVTLEEMRTAIDRLSSPDPDSRTPDHEGRRIEAVPGGWRVLNYGRYREKGQAKTGSRAPYLRDYRARREAEARASQDDVSRNTEAFHETQTTRSETTRSETPRSETPRRGSDDVGSSRADLQKALSALRGLADYAGLSDQEILDLPRFHAPTGRVVLATCGHGDLMLATAGKIRKATRRAKRLAALTDDEVSPEDQQWDERLGPRPGGSPVYRALRDLKENGGVFTNPEALTEFLGPKTIGETEGKA